jgi:hypothetical protein
VNELGGKRKGDILNFEDGNGTRSHFAACGGVLALNKFSDRNSGRNPFWN